MKNNWSIQEGESSLEYSNRLNSELNIKDIKKTFNTDEFYKFLTSKKNDAYQNVYNGILKAINCDIEEASNEGSLVGQNIEDLELYGSLVKGFFFSLVSKEMSYIPIATFLTTEEDEYTDHWSNRFGLIFFKKKKKYIMVNHSEESGDEGEVYQSEQSFKLIKDLSKKNKDLIEKFINKKIKIFHFSPKHIYLNNIIKWNLKNLSKNLPDHAGWGSVGSEEFKETKMWLIDYKKDFSKQILKKENFKKKVKG